MSADQHGPDSFCGVETKTVLEERSLGETAFSALFGLSPGTSDLFSFQLLVGLLLSNGPGTISAQGAKGAVSADGPEDPERVQLNKALIGFLTHSDYTHGGNGFEGIAFLLDQFADSGLTDPGNPAHGLDLKSTSDDVRRKLRQIQIEQENERQPGHPENPWRESPGV
ncbi:MULTISPECIES: hypothetical protein [Paraburkholderia]|uniref:hypothetical protein n=1 Tax=Paraburkholderia TaxID=1822464 RepID=UPI001FE6B2BF|nr:hypothetical protein [Paraburkholderia podalyriae]